MEVNNHETLAEVRACFDRYEAALLANELDTLDEFFWPDPLVIRYGTAENLYGIDAIRAWRRGSRPLGPSRSLFNTTVTTFGTDFATANTEFRWQGDRRIGRQAQTWVRLEAGWRIVSASVSFLDA